MIRSQAPSSEKVQRLDGHGRWGQRLRYSLTSLQRDSQQKAWQGPKAERHALAFIKPMVHCESNGIRMGVLDQSYHRDQ